MLVRKLPFADIYIHIGNMELKFSVPSICSDRSMINYRAFSDAIDSAFVMKSLERTPTATFTMTVGGTKVHKPNLLSHEQWEKFAALMNFFIEETMVRGVLLPSYALPVCYWHWRVCFVSGLLP